MESTRPPRNAHRRVASSLAGPLYLRGSYRVASGNGSGSRERWQRWWSVRHDEDLLAVRLVARGRVLLATACVIAVSTPTSMDSGRKALLYALGGFWVPWSGWLALNAERYPPRVTRILGAFSDLAVLFAVASLVDGSDAGVGLGCVIVVLLGTYTGGIHEGMVLSVAATAVVARAAGPRSYVAFIFAAVLAMLLLVVERGSRQQRQASLRSARLMGRSGAILDRVAEGVIVTDGGGVVLEANSAADRIMGCAEGAAVGHACGEFLALRSGERILDCTNGCCLLAMAAEKETDDGLEVSCMTADGRRRPLLANACAITNPDGEIDEIVHSLRDITALKQADEAKTLFLATASHELKTPLTVIRGYAELLLESPDLPEDARLQATRTIVRRSEELATIVDGLLLSSRIEAGRLSLNVIPVEAAPIMKERAMALQIATGRTVEVFVPADLPETEADPAALTTVIDHLLDNAVKFSPAGGPIALLAEFDDRHVRLMVADSGVGMDSVQAAHCFEKFWQGDQSDERRFRGSGIGLYIVRSLVEGMGGTVEVTSALGTGTTFTVSLSRTGAPEVPEPATIVQRPEGSIVREFMRQIGIPEGAR